MGRNAVFSTDFIFWIQATNVFGAGRILNLDCFGICLWQQTPVRPGNALTFLSEVAYPVYIVHMIFLYLAFLLIFQLDIAVQLQFLLVLIFIAVGCLAAFEGIRRVKLLRLLFGLNVGFHKI